MEKVENLDKAKLEKKDADREARKKVNRLKTFKTLFNHLQGVPSAAMWGTKFSSLFHTPLISPPTSEINTKNNPKEAATNEANPQKVMETNTKQVENMKKNPNLLYLSNHNLIYIDLSSKSFKQIITSNSIHKTNRPIILGSLFQNKIFIITELGNTLVFEFKDGLYYELFEPITLINGADLKKCKGYLRFTPKEQEELKSSPIMFIFSLETEEKQGKLVLIKFIYSTDQKEIILLSSFNLDKAVATDFIWINSNQDFAVGCSNGFVEIMNVSVDQTFTKKYSIEDKAMILCMDYSIPDKLLFTTNKKGILNIYDMEKCMGMLNKGEEIKDLKSITVDTKRCNDPKIKERYLFFIVQYYKDHKIIFSGNKGRLFTYDYRDKKLSEIPENYHRGCIYNSVSSENSIIFFSADHSFSLFNKRTLNNLTNIYTIPSRIKGTAVNEKEKFLFCLSQCKNENLALIYNLENKNHLATKKVNLRFLKGDQDVIMLKGNIDNPNELCFVLANGKIIVFNVFENKVLFKKRYSIEKDKILDVYFNKDLLSILFKDTKVLFINVVQKKQNYISFLDEKEHISLGLVNIKEGNLFLTCNKNTVKNSLKICLFSQVFNFAFQEIYDFTGDIHTTNIYYSLNQSEDLLNVKIFMIIDNNLRLLEIIFPNPQNLFDSFKKIEESKEPGHSNEIIKELSTYLTTTINHNMYVFKNIVINTPNYFVYSPERNIILLGQENGFVNIYEYSNTQMILLYQIKAHYQKITDINPLFQFSQTNQIKFSTSSFEQTIKIWDCEKCLPMNIKFFEGENNFQAKKKATMDGFPFIGAAIFFQQSHRTANKFLENFGKYYEEQSQKRTITHLDSENIEFDFYTYYKNIKDNYESAQQLIEYEKKNSRRMTAEKKKLYTHLEGVIKKGLSAIEVNTEGNAGNNTGNNATDNTGNNTGSEEKKDEEMKDEEKKENADLGLECGEIAMEEDFNDDDNIKLLTEEQNAEEFLDKLLMEKCYVEILVHIKAFKMGFDFYLKYLEKIKASMFINQINQFCKIEKIISILKPSA